MKKVIRLLTLSLVSAFVIFNLSLETKALENSREVRTFEEFKMAVEEGGISEIILMEDIYQEEEDAEPLVITKDLTIHGNENILYLQSEGIILEDDLVINDCDLRFAGNMGKSIILNYHELVLHNVTTGFSESTVDVYVGDISLHGPSLYRKGSHGVLLLTGYSFIDNIYAGNFGDTGEEAPVTIIISSPWVQVGTVDTLITKGKTATIVYNSKEREEKLLHLENGGNLQILSGQLTLTKDSYFYNEEASLFIEEDGALDISQIKSNLNFKDYMGEGKLLVGEDQKVDFSSSLALGISTVALIALGTGIVILKSK